MKKWKKYSFWFLLVVNLVAGLLPYTNLSYMLCWIPLAFILLVVNYKYTADMKRMLVLDITFFSSTQAEGWIACYRYAQTNPEDVGGAIIGIINVIHLIFSIFLLLAAMIWSFYIKGKKKQAGITGGILVFAIFIVVVFMYVIIVPFSYENNYVWIYKDAQYASSEKYEGMVDPDKGHVLICTKGGQKVTSITEGKLGIYPEQVALGDDFFYVLGGEGYDTYDTVVKVGYDSEVVAKRKVGYTDLMTCQGGTIFLGNEILEDENDVEQPDIINGYYANRYIAESDFENGEIEVCQADENGVCRVGEEVLYEHDGYFSTNPVIASYKGSNYYKLEPGEKLEREERTKWRMLVEDLVRQKGLAGKTCFVDEYQEGNMIYGVINVWDPVLGIPQKRLKCSLAYRILCEDRRLEVLREIDGVYMILATEECVLYQDGTELIREDLKKKEVKKLAEISAPSGLDVQVSGEYLVIDEGFDDEKRVRWKGENR